MWSPGSSGRRWLLFPFALHCRRFARARRRFAFHYRWMMACHEGIQPCCLGLLPNINELDLRAIARFGKLEGSNRMTMEAELMAQQQ